MDDRFEKKIKELLPYIIIEAIIFFLMPLFMGHSEGAATYIIQIGVFPLTAIGCCVFYKLRQQKSEIYVCIIAPLFYAISALLYGMWRDSAVNVLVYMASYFVCGYLGLLLADVLSKKKSDKGEKSIPEPKRSSPARVNVAGVEEEEPVVVENFKAEDPDEDVSLDTSTTDDDIEAILAAIHNRKS